MVTDKVIPIQARKSCDGSEWRAGEDKGQICGFREIRGFPVLSFKDFKHG